MPHGIAVSLGKPLECQTITQSVFQDLADVRVTDIFINNLAYLRIRQVAVITVLHNPSPKTPAKPRLFFYLDSARAVAHIALPIAGLAARFADAPFYSRFNPLTRRNNHHR